MAIRQLPIYKIVVNDEDTEVSYVALTDDPAIERNFMAFSNQKRFLMQSEEKRIVSGPLIVANLPIYRRDEKGEFYVVFDAETTEQIVQKFFKKGYQANVNLNHNSDQTPDGVYMFESMLIDTKRGINTPTGFDTLPDGSWFGSFKVENDAIWQQVKDGTFTGFSVEGILGFDYIKETDEDILLEIIDIIQNL